MQVYTVCIVCALPASVGLVRMDEGSNIVELSDESLENACHFFEDRGAYVLLAVDSECKTYCLPRTLLYLEYYKHAREVGSIHA